ncbi:MAG: hypothetical protein ACYSTJ_04665 [Planctomycetota bacterium]|jgi:hypothetical protein
MNKSIISVVRYTFFARFRNFSQNFPPYKAKPPLTPQIAPPLNHFSNFFIKNPHLFTPSAIPPAPDKAEDAAEKMHKEAATGNEPHEPQATKIGPGQRPIILKIAHFFCFMSLNPGEIFYVRVFYLLYF